MRPTQSLTGLLRSLWQRTEPRYQHQFLLLLALMLVSALAEVVSLGAIVPFIAILTAPEAALKHSSIARFAQLLGITSGDRLVLPLAIVFALAAVIAGVVRMSLLWATMRFTFAVGTHISLDVYRRTLYQPYQVQIARSSSEVIGGLTNQVGTVVLSVLLPLMTLISASFLLLAIMIALVVIDPLVAIAATVGFGGAYWAITRFFRPRLRHNSERLAFEYTQLVKALQEGLGGIRDVLLDGTQAVYCEIYRRADAQFRRAQGANVFIGQSPRYAMEAIGMVLIAALAYALSRQPGGVATALPTLGALALGAQRLLPSLQQAYAAWASVAGSQASLAGTVALLNQPLPPQLLLPDPAPLRFSDAIRFEGVRFRYSSEGPWVINGLDLEIARGARIGVVGGTGSGKSTALDLLMGLLQPTEGRLLVDGEMLAGERIRAWQRTVAHVPQHIYLADATLAENIAFGVPRERIDMERVRHAARQAQIAEFIESRPKGYEAAVGERGVRLSGGQRQRVGIARALYKQATVLVLDEATSALDNATEQSVMKAIEALESDLTILLIAHRLTTVQRCDTIVELEHGRVVAQGTYEDLLVGSASFRRMAFATNYT